MAGEARLNTNLAGHRHRVRNGDEGWALEQALECITVPVVAGHAGSALVRAIHAVATGRSATDADIDHADPAQGTHIQAEGGEGLEVESVHAGAAADGSRAGQARRNTF